MKSEKGQATVELALSITLLTFILFAIIDFGRIFHMYLTLENASREAARAAVVGKTDVEVNQIIITAAPTLAGEDVIVDITPTLASRTRGTYVTVKLTYPMTFSVPLFKEILPETINVSAETVMRME